MNVSVRLRGIIAVFALAGASIAQNRVPGELRIPPSQEESATDMYAGSPGLPCLPALRSIRPETYTSPRSETM